MHTLERNAARSIWLGLSLCLVACSNEKAGTSAHSDRAQRSSEITYHADIRALLEANCVECHRVGGMGPFPFESFEQVKSVAPAIVGAVSDGRMPPWPASDSCHPIADARALSAADKELFERWRDQGFQEGEERDYVAPEPKRRLNLGEPTLTFEGDAAFTPGANSDSYRCFLVGTVERDTYLTALDIIPGVESEVHHVQLHRVDAARVADVRALQDADPEGGYACSSSGVGSASIPSQNMFSYRPGALAVLFNEGDAAYLAQGSGLVLQIHYNTQFLPADESPSPDATRVAMWTLPSGEVPAHVIYRTGVLSPLSGPGDGTLIGALQYAKIPANESDVVGESTLAMRALSQFNPGILTTIGSGPFIPGEIVGMTPHAHAWATRMRARLNTGSARETCLIDVPRWDYGWQLDYMFQEGVPYGPDDMLHVECRFDNSAQNQPIINGAPRAPQDVFFGENTLNEMCLHYLWLRFRYEDFRAALSG